MGVGQHADKNRRWRCWIFLILMWIWGCSSLETRPPSHQWACDGVADAAVHQGDWEQALRLHQALLEREPSNCLAIYHLGYIRGKLSDRDDEVAQYERAVQCGYAHDDRLYFNLGMAYAEMGFMVDAISAFEQAAGLNPTNAENYFGLGLTTQAAGLTERAQRALSKAVELDPKHWEARILLARTHLEEGRLDAAQIQLETLMKSIPQNEEVEELWQRYEDRRMTSYER